jgi:predicted O-linked N-acetylglucosamine transferase (SPINDLY family)
VAVNAMNTDKASARIAALVSANQLIAAHDECQRLCQRAPGNAQAWLQLATIRGMLGRFAEAVAVFRHVLALDARLPLAHYNLGLCLLRLDEFDAAAESFGRALALKPDYADACHELANTLRQTGRIDEALACYRSVLELAPSLALARFNFANFLLRLGEWEDAEANFRILLDNPRLPRPAHSGLLHALNYYSRDAGEIGAAHRKWWAIHFAAMAPQAVHPNNRDCARRLRVGYVSPDLREHSVSFFIESLLAGHDRSACEVYCYADVPHPDAVTEHLRRHADKWRNTSAIGDAQLADQIRQDGVDILVDLAGHTYGNRLAVFAMKPAPVQISYLGYPATTGLPTMDYRLSDSVADPPEVSDPHYTEKLVRLPDGFLCYRGPEILPPVIAPGDPASTRPVTFGCFNSLSKYNAEVVAAWCEILRRVPGSRLFLKNEPLGEPWVCNRLLTRFLEAGIDPGRLELRGKIADRLGHLASYGDVDIALDTFPYNGATTTCEALWMGVPVITLAGTTHAGRVGMSILSRVRLGSLVARDMQGYISQAVELALDQGRRAELQSLLRPAMLTSTLCNASAFARNVEDAYRSIWSAWCSRVEFTG